MYNIIKKLRESGFVVCPSSSIVESRLIATAKNEIEVYDKYSEIDKYSIAMKGINIFFFRGTFGYMVAPKKNQNFPLICKEFFSAARKHVSVYKAMCSMEMFGGIEYPIDSYIRPITENTVVFADKFFTSMTKGKNVKIHFEVNLHTPEVIIEQNGLSHFALINEAFIDKTFNMESEQWIIEQVRKELLK